MTVRNYLVTISDGLPRAEGGSPRCLLVPAYSAEDAVRQAQLAIQQDPAINHFQVVRVGPALYDNISPQQPCCCGHAKSEHSALGCHALECSCCYFSSLVRPPGDKHPHAGVLPAAQDRVYEELFAKVLSR